MNLLSLIKKKSVADASRMIENAQWLQSSMSPYFFQAMADEEDALVLLAREMSTLQKNRRIILADRDKELILACVNSPGSLYDTLRRIGDREISYTMYSHSNRQMPDSQYELEVQRLEFDCRPHCEISHSNNPDVPIKLVRDVKVQLKKNFPGFDLKNGERLLSILWQNMSKNLVNSPISRIAWLVWLFERGNSSGGLFIDFTDIERDGCRETRILFAVGNPPKRDFMLQTLEVFNRLDVGIRRAYCYTISNGLHPYFLGEFFVASRKGESVSPGSELAGRLTRELCTTQILSTSSLAYSDFVVKGLINGEDAALVEAFISFCHTTLAHNQPDRYGFEDVQSAFFDHPEMSQTLINLFRCRFDPDITERETSYSEALKGASEAVESYNTGHRWLDELRRTVYHTSLLLIRYTLKTNFFIPTKQALAFRIDPSYINELGRESVSDLPETLPFRVTFFFSRFGCGYHIGFSDIARGGWRTVIARNPDDMITAQNTIFREVYVLAHTQHLKNKDIYEGGSKLVTLLDACGMEENGGEEETCRLYKLQYSIINAFLDIFVTRNGDAADPRVVDYYRDDEPIELGPDENMHDAMIETIAILSRKRGYILGNGIMSSKRIGINHKEYGVTSTGVFTFAAITMKQILGKDIYSDPFTIMMTGGPNGDVAGNSLRILLDQSPQMCLKLLLDGTAAIYDPSGIDHGALKELVLKQDLDAFIPEKLHCGAYIIYRSQSRKEGLRELHLKVSMGENGLEEEWLELDQFYAEFNNLLFSVEADIFIPAGGRPESVDSSNYSGFIKENGELKIKVIVEGANSFITPKGREELQKLGVVIMRDSSANKCGVISSSYEIIANLMMNDHEFLEHKSEYVSDVLAILKKRASDEAELILRRYMREGNNYSCTELSEQISREINTNYARLFRFFENRPELKTRELYIKAIYRHLPNILLKNRIFRNRIKQLPGKYISAILASEIASSIVYNDSAGADFEETIKRHLQRL